MAIQSNQCRIFAHIQAGQIVFLAPQHLQCYILAHIQTGQIVFGAKQPLQVGEELNALQTRDFLSVVSFHDIDLCDSILLALAERIAITRKFRLDVGSEIGVREVESVNGNGAIRDDFHVQGKGSVVVIQIAVLVGHRTCIVMHLQFPVSSFVGTHQVSDPAYIKVSGQDAGV